MTAYEKRLLAALKALVASTHEDEVDGMCITDIEFAVIEANALIYEIEHDETVKLTD